MLLRRLLQIVLPSVLAATNAVADAAAGPVKLAVEVSSHSQRQGEKIVVRVGLLSAANQPAQAPKAFSILLQARQASGQVEALQTVALQAGQSFNSVAVALPGSGLVYVWAKNAELLPGGAFVRVRAAESSARPSPDSAPTAPSAPAPPPSKPGAVAVTRAPARPSPLPEAPARPRLLPQITLRYSPDRQFLADGKDAVSIEAFLIGSEEAVRSDIHLNVYDSSNTMKPAPLTIRAGEPAGQSELTSSAPGTVTVEFLGSNPPAAFEGDRKLSIKFVPPITQISLVPSPPQISLVDRAELIVTLTDDQHRPLATSAPRQVALSIASGKGQIERRELQVPAGHFECRTGFVPQWPGQVTISASTPNFLTVSTPMEVSVPATLLLCSGVGGMVGGMLSQRTRRKSDRWRILIGLATGFLFYWACVFLGLTVVKREVVLNPLSALALSAIGGWMQTKVFNMVSGAIRPRAKGA